MIWTQEFLEGAATAGHTSRLMPWTVFLPSKRGSGGGFQQHLSSYYQRNQAPRSHCALRCSAAPPKSEECWTDNPLSIGGSVRCHDAARLPPILEGEGAASTSAFPLRYLGKRGLVLGAFTPHPRLLQVQHCMDWFKERNETTREENWGLTSSFSLCFSTSRTLKKKKSQ